jgi:hypothetical protein
VSDIPLGPILEVMEDTASSETSPVKYVCFPSIRMLHYAGSDHVMLYPTLKATSAELRGTFSPPSQPDTKIPLTPLFFWHDKPHIVSTAHYLSRVFPSRVAIPRGAFIEDTVGQQARTEMKEGKWTKWACWLYYPDEGKHLCLKHLNGRTWKGAEAEREEKLKWQGQRANSSSEGDQA